MLLYGFPEVSGQVMVLVFNEMSMKNKITTSGFIKKALIFWVVLVILHNLIIFLTDKLGDIPMEGSTIGLIRQINDSAIFLIICFIPILILLFLLIKIAERLINKAAEKYNQDK